MSSPLSSKALIYDPYYPRLKRHVIESTGLNYYEDRDEELAGRIAQRLLALGLSDCGSYLIRVQGAEGQPELDVLIADLTIGETFFFRHREQFDALRDIVLPDIIRRNESQGRRQIRIWSAGCSTGAEPYSLAILLKRDLAKQLAGWDVTILGTDINREFLAHAQRGEFGEWAFRSTPPEFRQTCFSQMGRLWVIAPEYRQTVSFQYHNLVQHPFPSLVNNLFAFDLILCRNVMIYFNAEVNQRLVNQFYETIVEGGWLLVGHAEPNVDVFRAYETFNVPGAVLYKKLGAGEPRRPAPHFFVAPELNGPTGFAGAATNVPTPPATRTDWLSPGLWVAPTLPEVPAAPPESWAIAPAVPPLVAATAPPPAPAPASLAEIRAKADLGQWEEAVRLCRELTARERLNPEAHFFEALVLEQAGKHAEAELGLRRTIYLDRNFALAHYYLGLTLQRKRDTAGAQRSFRNVVKLIESWDDAKTFANADGLTVGALKQLTQMQLSVLES